jgi:DNA primase
MPLRWEELEDPRLRADAYTLATLPDRLEREGDPWEGI